MRLLERDDTGQFYLTKPLPDDAIIPPYAILSHTWGDEEVLFRDLVDGTAKKKAGYAKIQFCGDQAWRDGLKYFWIDTCCIDKSDAAELQHALHSMFQWYRGAEKCYVYLTDVSTRKRDADGNCNWELAFRNCKWFTRGWTLQELIAPTAVEFFSKEGAYLGDKRSLGQQICNATGIPLGALQSNALSDFSIEERMSWVKNRNTTRKEDKAYSLFGIFDVCMPILYGEGEDRAFKRLREEISKDDRYLANLHSTDPRLDKKRIEEAKGGLLVNAYRWVLDSPNFHRWHDRSESRLLWIKGDPGKGKTMLLCGIINEVEQAIVAGGHCHNLAYFFCQATDSRINNATAVLRGLTYLLARQQPRLLSHVRKYIDAGKSLSDTNAWVALSDILTEMLEDPNLKATYLVVDALDECVVDLPKLLDLVVRVSSDRVKWLLSSRNEITIERKLRSDDKRTRLNLELKANAMQVSYAVNLYIDDKLSGLKPLQDNTLLEDGTLLKDRVRDILRDKANGTFLWVALVVQELSEEDVESWHVLQIVEEVPPGLDGMYDRMLNEIKRHGRDSEHCRRILSTVTVAYRPLHLTEIGALSRLPEQITKSTENVKIIVAKCGSFLTVRDNQIYLIHQSAKDFLLARGTQQSPRDAFNWVFSRGIEDAHHIIFSRSLDMMSAVLRRDIYSLEAPGFPIGEVQTPSRDPLVTVRYSCVFWVDHLCASISDKDTPQRNTLDVVQTFLEQKYLYWLEALSLLRAMSEGVIAIRQLEGLLGRTDQRQLTTFVRDAHRFALSYRWIVEQAPLQVYTSALIFAPVCSLVKKKFKTEEPSWISTKPVVEADWNACLQTLEGHRSSVWSVAFSPNGQRLVSGSDDRTIKIWDPTSGQSLQTLNGHYSSVRSVAFSPDGQQLASGFSYGTIKIWDPISGQSLQILEGHSASVQSITFSPNSQRLASGSDDNTIKIWDPTSEQYLQTLKGHSNSVYSVTFSPDGQRLVSGSDDRTIKIWDPTSGQCLQTLEGHSNSVRSVAFSPDGQQLVSGSDDRTIKIWDPTSGQCLQTLEGHSNSVRSVAFSPDGQQLVSGSDDCTIKIWDPISGQYLQTLKSHSNSVYSVAFSPDGQRLVSGSNDHTIKIWDPTSEQYPQALNSHSNSVYSVAFSPDGQRLVSGSDDRTIKIWDPTSGQCLRTLEGHRYSVYSVAFSPDSQQLASGSSNGTIKIWDRTSGQSLQTLEGYSASVYSVTFSPNGQRLALGFSNGTIKIWNPTLGQHFQTLEGHNASVWSVAFSPDDQRLASGSYNGSIKIWDLASERCLQKLKGHRRSVHSIAFSPDGQRLVSGSYNDTIKIWDLASERCLQKLKGHRRSVNPVAFSPDGQRLVSGSYNDTIKIWDPTPEQYFQSLKGYRRSVNPVAFSPDGQRLASDSCNDNTIKIWDPTSGECLQMLKGHPDSVRSVAFSVDNLGMYGYSLGEDQTWIICNGRNVLWLPPEYRPNCSAVHRQMISIGCRSGRVFIIGFSRYI
ncbi:Beta transducin-like protein HET-E2C [Madurella fahalii]|uniref:Beta transducin-like protein HET-E2C n=1 Tax=Madurella fahalii TaxID=1157608 RepID=A0ABQ0G2P0_9PEZI